MATDGGGDKHTTDQRRATWRAAQKARRARLLAKGKTLLRIWVTPAEEARIREMLGQKQTADDEGESDRRRRLDRLQQLQRRLKRAQRSTSL